MIKRALLVLFLICIPFTAGCVSKSTYNNKVLAARSLSSKLEKERKKNDILEKQIKTFTANQKKLKSTTASYQKSIKELEEQLDETDRMAETLRSNLDREVTDKNNEISSLQGMQEEERNTLLDSNTQLVKENKELTEKNTFNETEKEQLRSEIKIVTIENQDLATANIVQSKEMKELLSRINKLEKKLKKKIIRLDAREVLKQKIEKSLKKEIAAGQAVVTMNNETIKALISNTLLFDSKKISLLKNKGRDTLKKVGNILKSLKNVKISVEGHTDNRGISAKLKDKFPSNWNLSSARAISVVRYFTDGFKIDPQTISSAGHSSFHPLDTNETEKGRTKNRRIEIIIKPAHR